MNNMDFKTKNTYTIFFKDGTKYESSGGSESIRKSFIEEEFKWTAYHINKEVKLQGKTVDDIESVVYKLNYFDL